MNVHKQTHKHTNRQIRVIKFSNCFFAFTIKKGKKKALEIQLKIFKHVQFQSFSSISLSLSLSSYTHTLRYHYHYYYYFHYVFDK